MQCDSLFSSWIRGGPQSPVPRPGGFQELELQIGNGGPHLTQMVKCLSHPMRGTPSCNVTACSPVGSGGAPIPSFLSCSTVQESNTALAGDGASSCWQNLLARSFWVVVGRRALPKVSIGTQWRPLAELFFLQQQGKQPPPPSFDGEEASHLFHEPRLQGHRRAPPLL